MNWREVRVFKLEDCSNPKDGYRGSAGEKHDENIQTIEEREAVHKLMRLFLDKHKETLAGTYWQVGYLDPEIEINPRWYKGEKTTPQKIAMLWPGSEWKRVKEKYTSELTYNWETKVDGITIIIKKAESEAPRPKLTEGEIIDLSAEEDARGISRLRSHSVLDDFLRPQNQPAKHHEQT